MKVSGDGVFRLQGEVLENSVSEEDEIDGKAKQGVRQGGVVVAL